MSGEAAMSRQPMITLEQTAQRHRPPADQRATLVGLGLNKIGRRAARRRHARRLAA